MKTKKLNFSEMKNALSRDEMKKIMAGSDGICPSKRCSCDGGIKYCCDGDCTGLCTNWACPA